MAEIISSTDNVCEHEICRYNAIMIHITGQYIFEQYIFDT